MLIVVHSYLLPTSTCYLVNGVATGEMMRRLSVMIHASHMHVLYARWRFAGMSAAQAARGGDAGGAQGIR